MVVRISKGRCKAVLHAEAMASLPEMAALAQQFIAMGVEFERPIVNTPVLWSVAAA